MVCVSSSYFSLPSVHYCDVPPRAAALLTCTGLKSEPLFYLKFSCWSSNTECRSKRDSSLFQCRTLQLKKTEQENSSNTKHAFFKKTSQNLKNKCTLINYMANVKCQLPLQAEACHLVRAGQGILETVRCHWDLAEGLCTSTAFSIIHTQQTATPLYFHSPKWLSKKMFYCILNIKTILFFDCIIPYWLLEITIQRCWGVRRTRCVESS